MPTRYRPPRLVRIPRFIRRWTTKNSSVISAGLRGRRGRLAHCRSTVRSLSRRRDAVEPGNTVGEPRIDAGALLWRSLRRISRRCPCVQADFHSRFVAREHSAGGALASRDTLPIPRLGASIKARGIAFAIAQDSSYLGAHANALEDDILFFRVRARTPPSIDNVHVAAPASRAWHTLAVTLHLRMERHRYLARSRNCARRTRRAVVESRARKCCSMTSRSSRCSRDRGDYELAISA